jgi:hypothetical protein
MDDDPTLGAWNDDVAQASMNEADEPAPDEPTSEEHFIEMVGALVCPTAQTSTCGSRMHSVSSMHTEKKHGAMFYSRR